jgi:L-lactate dehydrogenase complex protein LldE
VLGLAGTAGAPAPGAWRMRPRTPVKVALHTSCSGRREMGTHLPSRALLAELPGVELVNFAREAECCGFGGTFSARHPAISGAMVQDKLQAVRDAGATCWSAPTAAACSTCTTRPRSRAAASGLPRCVHLGSFLRERLGAPDAAQQVTD